MQSKRFIFTLSLAALITAPAYARPVSYADSWTVMARNDADQNSLHVHYTIDRWHSVGARVRYDREGGFTFTGAQLNKLLKRWNKPDSQANVYAKVAAGFVSDSKGASEIRPDRDNDTGYMIGLSGDWETRRYFVSGEAQHWAQGRFGEETSYRARVGIAPYVANTGALHTWLMLEAHHEPEDADTLGATAIVRFFKGPGLLELGVDTDGEPLLNYIHRF